MSPLIYPLLQLPRRNRPMGALEIINHAQTLAIAAHHGQTRKDGFTPQILHPMSVQRLLAACRVDDPIVHAAALLHDALEENSGLAGQRILDAMERNLPPDVVATVAALTDPPGMSYDLRKSMQRDRLAQAPWRVQVVKFADVVASIQEGPAPGWSNEKKLAYVRQRTALVREVLSPACGRLRVLFERALRQSVWSVGP